MKTGFFVILTGVLLLCGAGCGSSENEPGKLPKDVGGPPKGKPQGSSAPPIAPPPRR